MSMQSKRDSSVGHVAGITAAAVVIALVSANAVDGSGIPDRLQDALVALSVAAALLWGIDSLLQRERERADERAIHAVRTAARSSAYLADELSKIAKRLDAIADTPTAAEQFARLDADVQGAVVSISRRINGG